MTRPFVPLVLCAVLALAASPLAVAAQDAEPPPKELWDEFPLEPSTTPAPAPEATAEAPPTRVVEVPADDGMAPGELLALIVAASAIGAVAARFAARRLPGTRGPAAPPAAAKPAPPAPSRRFRRKARPAAEGRPGPAPMRAAESRSAEASEANGHLFGQAPEPESTPPPRADARPAAPPEAQPAPPAPPPPQPQPKIEPAPKPARDWRERFGWTERSAPEPEPAPAARAPRPSETRQPSTGRFAPAAGAPRPAGRCSIKLSKRPPLGRFVALDDETGRVLARSPVFNLERADGDEALSPRDALREFVEELGSAGWRRTGVGPAPWELQFERQPDALTRRASPPRA